MTTRQCRHVAKAQCTAENSSVELSWVQFFAVYWTGDKLRRPSTAVGGSWQSRTCDGRRPSSQLVAGFRPMTDIALIGRFTRVWPDCEKPATTANFVAELSRIVVSRRRFNAQREAELNWTVELSWVEFSFPLCIGDHTFIVNKLSKTQLNMWQRIIER